MRSTNNPPGIVTLRRGYSIFAAAVGAYMVFLAWHHYGQLGMPIWRIPVIVISFAWLTLTVVAAHLNAPSKAETPDLSIAAIVPSHNEDPTMMRAMLDSLDAQTKPFAAVYFIENGGTDGNAERVFNEWAAQTPIPLTRFIYRAEPGKRDAQAVAFAQCTTDIIATIDGDTRLDPYANENGLKPFSDPKVMSVAGLLIGLNRAKNLLTRVLDLGFVSSFMNGRAAWSRFNSVAVNCGGLAYYRTWVVKTHLYDYRTQTVTGRKVSSGDDRILTGYAALEGKTKFQENAVAYTLLPENMSHLTRQRGRWWRSFWWGGVWLLRRFNPNRLIWWLVLSQYITFCLYAVMFPVILLVDPIVNQKFPWMFFLYIAGLSYVRSARTLAVKRPDQSTKAQIISYVLLSPLATIINLWLCTALQWWGLFTFRTTGWRTRQKVEVGLSPE